MSKAILHTEDGSRAAMIDALIDAINDHDVDRATGFFAAPDLADELRMLFAAFPDVAFETTEIVEAGSRIVVFWVARGTHEGPFMNIPATNREIEVHGISSFTVLDDIVRVDQLWDVAAMLRCMRLLPDWPPRHNLKPQRP